MKNQIMVVCCVCGIIVKWGRLLNGRVSHGYCNKHFKEAMNQLNDEGAKNGN